MSNYKKFIRACYIIGLVLLVWDVISFVMLFFEESTTLDIVIGASDIVCLLFCSIVFGVYNSHDDNYARKHKGLLTTAGCFSFWGSILLGALAVIGIRDLNSARVVTTENNSKDLNAESENKTEEVKNEEVSNEKVETSSEEVKKEEPLANKLIKEIKALDEMKKEGAISDEEYEILKKKILDEIVK